MENERASKPKSSLLIIVAVVVLILIAVLVARSLLTTSLGSDRHSRLWLMMGYDAARTNYNFLETTEPPLKQEKAFGLGSNSSSENTATTIFAADEDNIYLLSYSSSSAKDKKAENKIEAFDLETGKRKWRFSGGSMLGLGAVEDEHIYCVSTEPNVVFAIDVSTGKKVWQSKLADKGAAQQYYVPVVRRGIVYAVSENSELFALDGKTGKKRWVFSEIPVAGSPAVSGGLVYSVTKDGRVLALDAASGEQKWIVGAPNWTSLLNPAVGNGQVCLVDRDRRKATDTMIAIDARNGEMLWQSKIEPNVIINGFCIGKEKVFISLGEFKKAKPESRYQGKVFAVSSKNGKRLWKKETWGMPAFLVGAQDTLYVSSSKVWRGVNGRLHVEGGSIFAFSMDTGKEIEEYKVVRKKSGYEGTYFQPPLLISNGKLLAHDVVNNTVYVFAEEP